MSQWNSFKASEQMNIVLSHFCFDDDGDGQRNVPDVRRVKSKFAGFASFSSSSIYSVNPCVIWMGAESTWKSHSHWDRNLSTQHKDSY